MTTTRDACDVCHLTTPEMHYVAVARKLLCSRCWHAIARQTDKGPPAGQRTLGGVELVQPQSQAEPAR